MRTCQAYTPDALFRKANFAIDGFLGGQRPEDVLSGNTSKQDVLLWEHRALAQKRQAFPLIEPRR